MKSVLEILRPLLLLAFCVGVGKLFWSIVGEPRLLIELHSLTAVAFGGALYLTFRIADRPQLKIRHLWLANTLLFLFCQSMVFLGFVYTGLTGGSTPYHDVQALTRSFGYDPGLRTHVWLHIVNWVILTPTVITWVSGAPILWIRRSRLGLGRESDLRG